MNRFFKEQQESNYVDTMDEVCIGKINATESKFTWVIPNFSTIQMDEGKYIYSPTIRTTCRDEASNKIFNLSWCVRLYPRGRREKSYLEDHISVYLVKLDDIEVCTTFSIALMNKNNEVFIEGVSGDDIFYQNSNWGWPGFIKKESILNSQNGCLVNDALIVSCRIFSTTAIYDDQESDEETCTKAMTNHFDMLFNTGKFSDVTINVQNKELRAHKSILTSLSPVFQAMFENQMREQIENVVEIVDIEFDVINEMLRYMYARKVHGIEKIASDLFLAADRYCVKGLKRLCEKSLCKDLDDDNALQRFEMAIQYNAKRLNQEAVKLIKKNLKSFNAKEEFTKLSSDCKSEILSHVAKNRTKSFVTYERCDGEKPAEEDCSEALISHFDMLFNTGKFSDVTISVGEEKLQAHKSILSFFSPVFQAMFENQIEYKNESTFEIVDIEFKILKEMLRYVYAKKVNGIEEIASDLFVAADKYSVKGLKNFCENSLCDKLDEHNALQHLEMAVKHGMEKVKQKTVKLIVEKLESYVDKLEFKKLSSECKSELLRYIAEKFGDSM